MFYLISPKIGVMNSKNTGKFGNLTAIEKKIAKIYKPILKKNQVEEK